jgi:micrococcal nuclease
VRRGQKVRIAGIDVLETHPPRCADEARLGLAATAKLRELVSSGTVTVSGADHDQYGRELRSVQVNGQDVGEAMISAGLARDYGRGRRSWC